MSTNEFIGDGYTTLCPVGENDIDFVEKVMYSSKVREFNPLSQPMSRDRLLDRYTLGSNRYIFRIQSEEETKDIGICGLVNLDQTAGNSEIGINLLPEYWECGYGSQALSLLLDWAFLELRLRRVYGRIFEFNSRAIKFVERLGFCQEGRLRAHAFQKGCPTDVLLYGILKEEWSCLD